MMEAFHYCSQNIETMNGYIKELVLLEVSPGSAPVVFSKQLKI
jgi:hypothetical protein